MPAMTKLNPPTRGSAREPLVVADPIAEVEATILKEVQGGGAVPNQKILSQVNLAKRLGTSQYRVQRAIARLEQRGLVYGRKGSGVYLTERALQPPMTPTSAPSSGAVLPAAAEDPGSFLAMPHVPIFKTLRVLVDGIEADEIQVGMWRRVFDAFQQEYPFINLEPDFGRAQPGSAHDVVISALSAFGDTLPAQRPLDAKVLAQGGMEMNAFVDRVLDQGRTAPSRELFALPLLRSTTILAVNHRLFEQHGLADGPIICPADWFRVGFALVEKSGGRLFGFNYCGFHFHSTFYGIVLQEQDGRWVFDRARMAHFLEDIKPCIRRDQVAIKWSMNQFFDDHLGICCNYLNSYPWIVKRMGQAANLLRLPLEPGGFVTESSFVGAVPDGAGSVEEATLLLGFIASEKGQTALVENHPEWLSVHQAVLAKQKAASPFPEGSVIYGYDPRSVYSQVYPHRSFNVHWPKMETEAAKFFLGLQNLEEALAKMSLGEPLKKG